MELKHILESVLFANGKPLTIKEMKSILKDAAEYEPSPETDVHKQWKVEEIKAALKTLKEDYEAGSHHSFFLQEIGETYQFASKPEYGPWIKQLFDQYRPQRLSQSALETLAIIAYRQPITRADIEAVRGVQVDAMVQTLMERGLIKISGRAELPGRPMLYETTQTFLEHFGLKSLDEMPNAEELRTLKLKTAEADPQETPSGEQTVELPLEPSSEDASPQTAEPTDQSMTKNQIQDIPAPEDTKSEA